MLLDEIRVSLLDLVKCISTALKLISPEMARHHNQAAYITYKMAGVLGYSEERIIRASLAAALHDIGAISLEEELRNLSFEDRTIHNHAELGYQFLNAFSPFRYLAPLVRYHHEKWEHGQGAFTGQGDVIREECHLIHLADRAAVLIQEGDILSHKDIICKSILARKDKIFMPEHVDAFLTLADTEYFWLDCVSPALDQIIEKLFIWKTVSLKLQEFIEFSRFLSRLVDFRSPLNANHSSGVAASAACLAEQARFSKLECSKMQMAGYLHDIGKLTVPTSILEKRGPLTENERNIIKRHSYYTYHTLIHIEGLERITAWAALHHERMDGKGYPFHFKGYDLPLGAQIIAVADVYTALNEERPYRSPMSRQDSIKLMRNMVADGALNGDLVELLVSNFDEINASRLNAQHISGSEYNILNPIFRQKKVNL